MSGMFILVVIIAFIGNRIFGLYKDETTTRILEESGAIRPRKPQYRSEWGDSPRRQRQGGAKLTPYQVQFRKNRAILDRMAAREAKRVLRKYGLEG